MADEKWWIGNGPHPFEQQIERLVREAPHPELLTARQYLTRRAMLGGASMWLAIEAAVSSTAIEHPEWDMDEERSWAEWEAEGGPWWTTTE